MGTRFYTPYADVEPVTTVADTAGTWLSVAGAEKRCLNPVKGSSVPTAGPTFTVGTAGPILARRAVSAPLAAGQTISGTYKSQVMVRELNTNDDVNRPVTGIRIVSNDGSTELGVLKAPGNYGTNAEFSSSGFRNCKFADGDSITSYGPTVGGERLVVEWGYRQTVAGTTPEAAALWGESEPDLAENDTQTIVGSPWIEFSHTFVFAGPVLGYAVPAAGLVIGGGVVLGSAVAALGFVAGAGFIAGTVVPAAGFGTGAGIVTATAVPATGFAQSGSPYVAPDLESAFYGSAVAINPASPADQTINPARARVWFLHTATGNVLLAHATTQIPHLSLGHGLLYIACGTGSATPVAIKDALGNTLHSLANAKGVIVSLLSRTPAQGSWLFHEADSV